MTMVFPSRPIKRLERWSTIPESANILGVVPQRVTQMIDYCEFDFGTLECSSCGELSCSCLDTGGDVRVVGQGKVYLLRTSAVYAKKLERAADADERALRRQAREEAAARTQEFLRERAAIATVRAVDRAEDFSEEAEAAGWKTRITVGKPYPTGAQVVATKGEQVLTLVWRGSAFQREDSTYVGCKGAGPELIDKGRANRILAQPE